MLNHSLEFLDGEAAKPSEANSEIVRVCGAATQSSTVYWLPDADWKLTLCVQNVTMETEHKQQLNLHS